MPYWFHNKLLKNQFIKTLFVYDNEPQFGEKKEEQSSLVLKNIYMVSAFCVMTKTIEDLGREKKIMQIKLCNQSMIFGFYIETNTFHLRQI